MHSAHSTRPTISLQVEFSRQADAAAELGSALWADVCDRAARELADPHSALSVMLSPWNPTCAGDYFALRVLAAAHRFALERSAPLLAIYLPTLGGSAPRTAAGRAAAYAAFIAALHDNEARLPELLAHPPQTNEPGRAAALAGVLHHVAAHFDAPIRLVEVAASAGLNLHADRFRIDVGAQFVGPADSPVRLERAWLAKDERALPPVTDPTVVERIGCDLRPVDVETQEGRLSLTSFVWPDQVARFDRLRSALSLAQRFPVVVVEADVVEFLHRLVPQDHAVNVAWHSVVWSYLDPDTRRATLEAVTDFASRSEGPVVHAVLEDWENRADGQLVVAARSWPGVGSAQAGQWTVHGHAPAHGLPVTWNEPYPLAPDDQAE